MASYQKLTLPSGLRTLTVSLPDSETATVLVLVKAGSKYETKEVNGVSHFLEHMLFKGTEKRPDKKEIASVLDRVGASYNAFTSKEHTGYYIKVAKEHAELALDMVSDIYCNSLLPAKEIEKERKVILEELKMDEDMPMTKVAWLFEELVYGDTVLGWPVGGTKQSVQNISHNHIVDYYHRFYSSARTLVCLSGPWEHSEALEKIKQYFGNVNQNKSEIKDVAVKEVQNEPGQKFHTKPTDQTHLVLGFRAYGLNHPNRFILELLSTALGGMMSSRLFLKVREEQALAYYIHSDAQRYSNFGYFAIQAGVDNERVNQAISAVIEEVNAVKQKGLSEDELQKAKDHLRGATALALESSSDWASFYGGQEILLGQVLTPQEILRQIDKVSLEDISRVCRDIFQNNKLNLALVGPAGKREQASFGKLLRID